MLLMTILRLVIVRRQLDLGNLSRTRCGKLSGRNIYLSIMRNFASGNSLACTEKPYYSVISLSDKSGLTQLRSVSSQCG